MSNNVNIKFDNDLPHQNDAISSVVDLFPQTKGSNGSFTMYTPEYNLDKNWEDDGVGKSNDDKLIDEDDFLSKLNVVRSNNNLKEVKKLSKDNINLAIEMETGTGKTFVYLKTIFELNKKCGFTKFIILVPSIAIIEGVMSSLDSLKSFFTYNYQNVPFNYFKYNSDKLSNLMSFARSDSIEIMVMTIQSMDRESNILFSTKPKDIEVTHNVRPIDIINSCRPIVIIDEPQTTSNTKNRQDNIKDLTPLFTMQYSATHKDNKNVHKVYRLTAVDAYLLKLVKQIEVATVVAKDDINKAYIELVETKSTKSKITATVKLDIRNPKDGNITRKAIQVKLNDNLYVKTNKRDLYDGLRIERIQCDENNQSITVNGDVITKGQAINSVDEDLIKRAQIKKTIEEHFEKEKLLNPIGIKVLSIFFIDKVANYRQYDSDNIINGKFHKMFEEEYIKLLEKYKGFESIVARNTDVTKVHEGYFSIDKGKIKDTKGESEKDIEAYQSIMSDKGSLLSFDNDIRFIFSHTALREGWDNPNVFQICTLNEKSKNNDRKRQEIGRGLRICVNQSGERQYGFKYNTLTVMANESYEDFAKALQLEIEQDENFKFGMVEDLSFLGIKLQNSDQEITEEQSKILYKYCKDEKYINSKGEVTDKLKKAIRDKTFELPKDLEELQYEVKEYLTKVCGNLNIKPKTQKKIFNKKNKDITDSPEFKILWDRIKDKTRYQIDFDTDELIEECSNKISEIEIDEIKLGYVKGKISQNTTNVEATMTSDDSDVIDLKPNNRYLPDILTYIQNETDLTRRTIVEILKKCGVLYLFYQNPQKFMIEASKVINKVLIEKSLDGISYKQLENSEYFLQEVFPDDDFEIVVDDYVKSGKSVYEYNYYESDPEKKFAEELNNLEDVLVYAKLPTHKFVVPTPIGDYTPDWVVILKETTSKPMLYFVVETKSTKDESKRRINENMKIKFGEKRFNDVGGAGFVTVTKKEELLKERNKFNDDGSKTFKK